MAQASAKTLEKDAPKTPRSDRRRYEAILDGAEFVFANEGYNGASMRKIALKAGVAQALIHYHFANKDKLHEAMIARRSTAINASRQNLLRELLQRRESPSLEEIVRALFRPTIETGRELARDGGGFSKILVSIANSTDPRSRELACKYYDPIAQNFIDAFCQIEPGLQRKDAVWAYMFSIGVGMTMMAQTGRSTRLSNGECDDSDIETMLTEIVVYVCGGIRALIAKNANSPELK